MKRGGKGVISQPIVHIVEDTKVQRRLYVRAVGLLGFQVEEHENAEAFLAYLEREPQALADSAAIITDYNMRAMNGAQLVAEIRRQEAQLRPPLAEPIIIIGLSAEGKQHVVSGSEAIGAFKRAGATAAYNKSSFDPLKLKEAFQHAFMRYGVFGRCGLPVPDNNKAFSSILHYGGEEKSDIRTAQIGDVIGSGLFDVELPLLSHDDPNGVRYSDESFSLEAKQGGSPVPELSTSFVETTIHVVVEQSHRDVIEKDKISEEKTIEECSPLRQKPVLREGVPSTVISRVWSRFTSCFSSANRVVVGSSR